MLSEFGQKRSPEDELYRVHLFLGCPGQTKTSALEREPETRLTPAMYTTSQIPQSMHFFVERC